jgi:acylphosphatase
MGKTRAHVYVTGMVQGVFYRSFIRTKARLLRLNGWVKNTMDGCIEVVFEGEEQDVHEAVELCRRGPPQAKVTDVRVEWEKPHGDVQSFEIKQ